MCQSMEPSSANPRMETLWFNFSSEEEEEEEQLRVQIKEEVKEADYSQWIWPSAPVLAQFVWFNRDMFQGKRVLEIGCGTALPGITAAKIGANVILSDDHHCAHWQQVSQNNVQANGLRVDLEAGPEIVQLMPLTWGVFSAEVVSLAPVDIILGSDCFYEFDRFEDIVATVSYVCDKSRGSTVFYTTYQERVSDWNITCLLERWGLTCEYLDLATFGADSPNVAESCLPGNHSILMLKITERCGK